MNLLNTTTTRQKLFIDKLSNNYYSDVVYNTVAYEFNKTVLMLVIIMSSVMMLGLHLYGDTNIACFVVECIVVISMIVLTVTMFLFKKRYLASKRRKRAE